MQNTATKLFEYHKWAVDKTLAHLHGLSEDVVIGELNNVFPSIKDTLIHLYVIEHGWLSTIQGKESTDIEEMKNRTDALTEMAREKSLTELEKLFKNLYAEYDKTLSGIEDVHEEKIIFFGQLPCSYQDMVIHVVNHGTYHRGNITSMLRQQKYAGCNTDYGAYLFEKK